MSDFVDFTDVEIEIKTKNIDFEQLILQTQKQEIIHMPNDLPENIWMAIDFETIDDFSLKLFCKTDPIQIGFVIYDDNDVEIYKFSSYIFPKNKFNFANTSKIKWNDVRTAPSLEDIAPMLEKLLKKCKFIVSHNYPTELGILKKLFPNLSVKVYDTLYTSRNNFKNVKRHKLSECCARFNIDNRICHSAVDDASMTAKLYITMKKFCPYFVIVENGQLVSKGNFFY